MKSLLSWFTLGGSSSSSWFWCGFGVSTFWIEETNNLLLRVFLKFLLHLFSQIGQRTHFVKTSLMLEIIKSIKENI